MANQQPPEVGRVLRDFNRYLANRESDQMIEMARRWKQIEDTLNSSMTNLAMDIAERRAAGLAVGDTAITRMASYKTMLKQVAAEASRYEQYAEKAIRAEQSAYAQAGLDAAASAIRAGMGVGYAFDRVPISAIQNMVGLTADGSPLFSVLEKRALAPDMVAGLTRNLIEAISMGYSPRKTAEMMADGLADGLSKALVIARTEQIRAFREATLMQYQETGFIQQYQRHAVPAERTCLACLALDGQISDVNEPVESHPNCRCFITPIIPGFDTPKTDSGESWLEKQDEKTQRAILGDARYQLWQDGTPLSAMVKIKDDPVWGPTIGIRKLGDIGEAGTSISMVLPVPSPQTDHPNLYTVFGNNISVADYTISGVQKHLNDLDLIPRKTLEALNNNGVKFYIGDSTVPGLNNMHFLKGVQPRGWPPGFTWDNVPCCYSDIEGVILGIGRHGSTSAALHETGHAIGDKLGVDLSQEIINFHIAHFTKLSLYQQQDGPGSLSGRQEFFAESVANILFGKNGIYDQNYIDFVMELLQKGSM